MGWAKLTGKVGDGPQDRVVLHRGVAHYRRPAHVRRQLPHPGQLPPKKGTFELGAAKGAANVRQQSRLMCGGSSRTPASCRPTRRSSAEGALFADGAAQLRRGSQAAAAPAALRRRSARLGARLIFGGGSSRTPGGCHQQGAGRPSRSRAPALKPARSMALRVVPLNGQPVGLPLNGQPIGLPSVATQWAAHWVALGCSMGSPLGCLRLPLNGQPIFVACRGWSRPPALRRGTRAARPGFGGRRHGSQSRGRPWDLSRRSAAFGANT